MNNNYPRICIDYLRWGSYSANNRIGNADTRRTKPIINVAIQYLQLAAEGAVFFEKLAKGRDQS
jgi:hypothetical protein